MKRDFFVLYLLEKLISSNQAVFVFYLVYLSTRLLVTRLL